MQEEHLNHCIAEIDLGNLQQSSFCLFYVLLIPVLVSFMLLASLP